VITKDTEFKVVFSLGALRPLWLELR